MANKGAAKKPATEEQKAAAAPKPPVPKDIQNGITRPKEGTQTGRVWEIADAISTEKGEPAARKDVLALFMEEGGNPSTGATQYGRWRKYHGLAGNGDGKPGRPKKQKEEAAPAEEAGETQQAPIAPPAQEELPVEDNQEVAGDEEEEA